MSVEDSIEPPEVQPEGYVSHLELLDGYEINTARLKAAVESAIAVPDRMTMQEMQAAVTEARRLLNTLFRNNFFHGSGNDMLVSRAITTYVSSLTAVCQGMLLLDPNNEPMAIIRPDLLPDETDRPNLEITAKDGPVPVEDVEREDQAIERIAKLIVERDGYDANRISTELQAVGLRAYEGLLNRLRVHPLTSDYLKKAERIDKLKHNAKKYSAIGATAIFGGMAGQPALELIIRHL